MENSKALEKLKGIDAVSLENRYRIAAVETKLIEEKFAENTAEANNHVDHLRAVLEEIRLRILDTQKSAYDFSRDCVVHAHDENTINAEKIKRHIENNLEDKKCQIKKLWQKNRQLQTSISKLEKQLKQKEEQEGDALDSVDLEQLKIQNSQYNSKIAEKNEELLKLKIVTGKTIQKLNRAKEELNKQINLDNDLKRLIGERSTTADQLKIDLIELKKEISKKEKQISELRSKISNTDMPQVMEYVKQKAKELEYREQINNWTRKVEIAQLAVNNAKKNKKNQLMENVEY